MKKLIRKFQGGNSITLVNDAIKVQQPNIKPMYFQNKVTGDQPVYQVIGNEAGNPYEIAINYPGLTALQQKDKSAVERLYSRPYTNRQYLDLQRQMNWANQRDIQLGTLGAGATVGLATILSGGASTPLSELGIPKGIASLYNPGSISGIATSLAALKAAKDNYEFNEPYQYLETGLDMAGLPIMASLSEVDDLVKNFNLQQYNWLKAHPEYTISLEAPGQLRLMSTGPNQKSLQVRGSDGKYKNLTALMGKTEAQVKAEQRAAEEAAQAAQIKKLARLSKEIPKKAASKYAPILESHNATTYDDGLPGLNWAFDQTHSGMPIEKLIQKKAIDSNWFDDYYRNVTETMIPLEKELRANGDLVHGSMQNGKFVQGEGKWYGKIDGSYVRVDPYHYVVSRSPKFIKSGNTYKGYPWEQSSGVKFNKFEDNFWRPDAQRNYPIFTVEGMGPKGTELKNFYTGWKGGEGKAGKSGTKPVRYQVPIIHPKQTPGIRLTGSTESTSGGGALINQTGRAPVLRFEGEDKGIYPAYINIYDSSLPDIKSWWNNYNFTPGAGPLSFIESKINDNLT